MKTAFPERYKKVLDLLVAARQEKKVPQSYIARAFKKYQSFVTKYEKNERHLDVVEFIETCRVIGVNPLEILHDAEQITEGDLKDMVAILARRPLKKK